MVRKREQELALYEQSYHLLHEKSAVIKKADVDNGAWNRPNPLAAALLFVTYLYLVHTALAVPNNIFYTMFKAWNGIAQCDL